MRSHTESQERRARIDRRRRLWWAVWYGSFNPRRRTSPRRHIEPRFHWLDWHSPHLMAVAIAISILSVGDAFLTMGLLQGGAQEMNPVMAALIYRSVAAFAAFKMLLTGVGVVLMAVLARYRLLRVLPVAWLLYGVLTAYCALIGYEVWMHKSLIGEAIF